MKIFLISFVFGITLTANAQLVFNNGGLLVMNGGSAATPVFTVLGGTAIPTTPITVVSNGGIIAENQFNKLRYNLGTNTTPITVPFVRNATLTNTVSTTFSGITAGVGAGQIDFSNKAATTLATGWDNTNYLPTMVTHMSQSTAPGTNGSDYAIDRFWLINATAYSTKPSGTLVFKYLDDELATNGGNSITESNLIAQRFNTTSNIWGDYFMGTVNTTSNTVTTSVTAAQLFTTWTLTDRTNPLPITLKSLIATCNTTNALITWVTASEVNNDYFQLQKSNDAINFETIATIAGAGTSSIAHTYNYNDEKLANNTVYYRLKQVDFDGKYSYSSIITTNCGSTTYINNFEFEQAYASSDYSFDIVLESPSDASSTIQLFNLLGQLIYDGNQELVKGYNQQRLLCNYISSGMYIVSITTNNVTKTKKIIKN